MTMKTNIKQLTLLALLSSAALTVNAQALRTGYFSDSYLYRHQMNPALANTSAYFCMPVLGNMSVDFGANFGVKNFIFERPDGDGLTTFMHPGIKKGFLDDLEEMNKMNLNLDFSVISVGFNAFGGYNTIESGLHTRAHVGLDRDLFRFMKEMSSNRIYDLSKTRATAMAWEDISLGHSRQITEDLRVGLKVKVLLGLAYADADFDGTKAYFGDDMWLINMRGNLNIAGGGKMTTKEGSQEMDGYDDFQAGVNGFGMAFDMGATYRMPMVPGLTLSTALTDIGTIKWDCEQAKAGNEPFRFDGFQDAKIHSEQGSVDPKTGKSGYYDGTMDEQMERIGDDLEDMVKLNVSGSKKKKQGMGVTMTMGAEYELPVYTKISFGALYTQRFSKTFGYAEGRLVTNYAPSRIFDLALSGSLSSYGASFGTLLNLHVPGFNLFVGLDRCYCGSVNNDMVPLEKGSTNFAFGINFPLGL
jgi:hypothetical protein